MGNDIAQNGNNVNRLTSNDYTKNLLQAMSIIAKKEAKDNVYNKTILATVVRCEDANIGKYKIKYQDGYWYAYSLSLDVVYSQGATVYILVPNGDMSKDKIILSATQKSEENFINFFAEDLYETSANLIKKLDVELCSYKNEVREIELLEDYIILDSIEKFKDYTYLTLGCTVQTKIPDEQQQQGNFGLKVYLKFVNKSDNTLEKIVPYTFDIRYMQGTVYNLTVPLVQQKNDYSCNNPDFIGIEKIEVFVENFPRQQEDKENDIFLTDIIIAGSNKLDANAVVSYLQVTSEDNFIFNGDTLTTEATLYTRRDKRKNPYKSTLKIPIYWFRRNNQIDKKSKAYRSVAGEGWEVLNSKPTKKRKFIFNKEDVLTSQEEFFCVSAEKEGIKEKKFSLYNNDARYEVTIIQSESDAKSNYFYLDYGQATLTAVCTDKEEAQEEYSYYWISKDFYGNVIKESENASITIKASDILQEKEYSCSVYKNGVLIGSASTVYYNTDELDTEGYSVELSGGNQVFTYNADGMAPNCDFLQNPIKIEDLKVIVKDNLGNNVEDFSVKWIIPSENTLLKDITEEDNTHTVHFNIEEFYNVNKKNNEIQVIVSYGPIQLFAKTNFSFIKRGNSGTIGNRVYIKVEPNAAGDQPTWPIIYYNEQGIGIPNWQLPANDVGWFKVRVWDKKQIDSNFEITWALAGDEDTSTSWFIFDEQKGVVGFQRPASPEQAPNLIVRAKVIYNGVAWYGTLPVAAALSQQQQIDISNGCKYVVYNQYGKNPTHIPFSFVIENYIKDFLWVPQGCCFKFIGRTETADGFVEDLTAREEFISFNNFNGSLSFDDNYDGSFVRNMILGEDLYIPIHLYLDYYQNSSLSVWDGNSIDLGVREIDNTTGDETGLETEQVTPVYEKMGTIFSPQMGSGTKDEDGRFTGIIYGKSEESDGNHEGLLGYYEGERTLFLDSQTGRAEFGKNGAGQLIIDPSQNVAQLFSGNYKERKYLSDTKKLEEGEEDVLVEFGSGLLIDLTTPLIKFGSGEFSIDKEGNLKATSGLIGGWIITDEDIRNMEDETSIDENGNEVKNPNFVSLGPSQLRLGTLTINSDGSMEGPDKDGNDVPQWYITADGIAYFRNITIENGNIEITNTGKISENAIITTSSGNVTLKNYVIEHGGGGGGGEGGSVPSTTITLQIGDKTYILYGYEGSNGG